MAATATQVAPWIEPIFNRRSEGEPIWPRNRQRKEQADRQDHHDRHSHEIGKRRLPDVNPLSIPSPSNDEYSSTQKGPEMRQDLLVMRADATNASSSRKTLIRIMTRSMSTGLAVRFVKAIRSLSKIPVPAATNAFNPWSIVTDTKALSCQVNARPVFVARVRPRSPADSIRATGRRKTRFFSSSDTE